MATAKHSSTHRSTLSMDHGRHQVAGLDIGLGEGEDDPLWDEFVNRVPGGHHVQTSLWGQVKRLVGWRGVRVVVRRGNEVVGGCQLLLRRVGPVAVGYVPRGPLALDEEALDAALDGLDQTAGRYRVAYLKVQPPPGRLTVPSPLPSRGFVPSALAGGPTATVLLDLRRDRDEMWRALRSGVRSNIGKAERKGVRVRPGDASDLPAFMELVRATSRRQGFPPYPASYYSCIWELFSRRGRARLVVAEHGGKMLTALLLVGWNDTVVYKMGGWSGERSAIHPNEAAHWAGIQWAQDQGYAAYDLEGIDRAIAVAKLRGEATPPDAGSGVTHFKMGFGGEVVLLPEAYDRSLRALSPLLERVSPKLDRAQGLARRLLGRRA